MSEGIIILGAGGHAKVIADILLASGEPLAGFLDDHVKGPVLDRPVLGTLADIDTFAGTHVFVMGIGDNQTRKKIGERCAVRWHRAIHPAATIAKSASIGEGSVVMAGAIVNPCARIGRHSIINTAAVVEHDCVVSDYVHLSPGVRLSGKVEIGEGTWLGTSAAVVNNVSVCAGCTIGAGTVVVKDITVPGTYVGVPAKRCR